MGPISGGLRPLVAALVLMMLGGCGSGGARTAQPQSGSDGAHLFLAGDGEIWIVDAEKETSRRVEMPQLSAGDPPHRVLASDGRLAFWGFDVFAADTERPRGTLERIAEDSWILVPGSSRDSIWVGFLADDATRYDRKLGELRELSFGGDVLRRGVVPPGGMWPYSGMSGGLLFWAEKSIYLWDPDAGQVVRSFPADELGGLGPVSEDLVASCRVDPCERLLITNFDDGSKRTFRAPSNQFFDVYSASFSPDAELLAVPTMGTEKAVSGPASLALVDLEDAEVDRVPKSQLREGYRYTVWSEDGRRVFMTGGMIGEKRVIESYELGADAAERIDVQVGDFYDIAAE